MFKLLCLNKRKKTGLIKNLIFKLYKKYLDIYFINKYDVYQTSYGYTYVYPTKKLTFADI